MINKLFTMEGNVCVVTGGSRGLGFYMAQGFLEAGAARVYITARKAAACIEAAEELSQFGECVALPGDISSMEGIQDLTAALEEREESIDVLVNNAGAGWGAPLEEFPEKGWDKVMDTNVKGVFFLTQKLLPMLKAAGNSEDPARVINIGSMSGIIPLSRVFTYSMTKAAVHNISKNLAREFAPKNVRVNCLCPGFFPAMHSSW